MAIKTKAEMLRYLSSVKRHWDSNGIPEEGRKLVVTLNPPINHTHREIAGKFMGIEVEIEVPS